MRIERFRSHLCSALLAIAGAACDGEPLEPPSVGSSTSLEPAPAPQLVSDASFGPKTATVAAIAAAPTASWRPWVESELERLRAERPEHLEAVMTLAPRPTRAGLLRLTGPLVRDPDSAPILIHRLYRGGEPPEARAALVEALPRTTGDYSAALADAMTLEAEPRVRELIASSLARARAPYALDGLEVGLVDPHPRVRAEALRSLGRRPDGARHVARIIDALADAEEVVAVEAARALGNLEAPEAKSALVARLDSGSATLRRHSLRALSRIDLRFTRSLPQLVRLRADPDPKVARAAARVAESD